MSKKRRRDKHDKFAVVLIYGCIAIIFWFTYVWATMPFGG